MANSLRMELAGKAVVFKDKWLNVPPAEHPFLVEYGFGAFPNTHGTALVGRFLSDGEDYRMEGYMVERLATEEEIKVALAKPKEKAGPDFEASARSFFRLSAKDA